jgi:hypothetical protein
MTVKEVLSVLEILAPPGLAVCQDNIYGLLLEVTR